MIIRVKVDNYGNISLSHWFHIRCKYTTVKHKTAKEADATNKITINNGGVV